MSSNKYKNALKWNFLKFIEFFIRLDLFHACLRIVQTISKKDSYGEQLSSELFLILRRNGDLGTGRTTSTPDSDEIEANLERLFFSWKDRFPKETVH